MPPKGSTYRSGMPKPLGGWKSGPLGQRGRRKGTKSGYMPATGQKMRKFKPRIDNVVTRKFNYIFKPFDNAFSTDCYIGNVKGGVFSRAYLFNIVDVPGLNPYLGPNGPFTQYRVDEITYRFMAVGNQFIVDDTDNGGVVQIQKTQPMIYFSSITGAERQGEIQYQSEDQAVFDSKMKPVKCGEDFKLKFVPNHLTYVQSQREGTGANITNPVLQAKKSQWMGDRFNYIAGSSVAGTNFYGFKVLVGDTNAEEGEYVYKVYVSIKVSFRGQSDNSNVQIAASAYNHRIFTA